MRIRVSVVAPDDTHPNFRLRYRDPDTKRQHWRSSGTTNEKKAYQAAARWEDELNDGIGPGTAITWKAFWERYEKEVLPGLAKKTQKNYRSTKQLVEEHIKPGKLAGINARVLSDFAARLRSLPRSENTVKTHINQLRAMLGWAKQQRLLGFVPPAPKTHRAKRADSPMRGRPITEAEFQSMLTATPLVVGEIAAHSWKHWIEGLWWSGLRLEESLGLSWDNPQYLSVDLSGKYPMLAVPRWAEKGHRDRLLPMAPEFAEFLLKTPAEDRRGFVFRLAGVKSPTGGGRTSPEPQDNPDWVGRICSRIGRKAGVAVDTYENGRIKYASAHDLRRSFGERWARRVMPADLQVLMRHEDIKTTMKYYHRRNAESTASAAWDAYKQNGPNANGSVDGSDGQPKPKQRRKRNGTNADNKKS